MNQNIDDLILESLSFYTPLSIDQIILELDDHKIKQFPNFNLDTLEKRIRYYVKVKKIKVLKSDGKVTFLKMYPKRKNSLFRFLVYFLGLLKRGILNKINKPSKQKN